ncbi:MAG: hypothetical protein ACRCYO_01310 [Bacteroidia bacterium]
MKKTLFLFLLTLSLTATAQDRRTLLQAAVKLSTAPDTFLLRDSVLQHFYSDWESDSILIAGLKSESYITPADIDFMLQQARASKIQTWTKDSIAGSVVIASKGLPNSLKQKKAAKQWTKYFSKHKTGYYEVSKPIFSKDGKTAIVYVSFQCGVNCGNGGASVYRWKNDKWVLEKNLFSWRK